jgi:hypothetical protein
MDMSSGSYGVVVVATVLEGRRCTATAATTATAAIHAPIILMRVCELDRTRCALCVERPRVTRRADATRLQHQTERGTWTHEEVTCHTLER